MWPDRRGATPHVTVRAMILSVIGFDIDEVNATRAVEKKWKAYQRVLVQTPPKSAVAVKIIPEEYQAARIAAKYLGQFWVCPGAFPS